MLFIVLALSVWSFLIVFFPLYSLYGYTPWDWYRGWVLKRGKISDIIYVLPRFHIYPKPIMWTLGSDEQFIAAGNLMIKERKILWDGMSDISLPPANVLLSDKTIWPTKYLRDQLDSEGWYSGQSN